MLAHEGKIYRKTCYMVGTAHVLISHEITNKGVNIHTIIIIK